MHIQKVKYSQYINDSKEWNITGFDLKKINLIVGKNSAGKSKSLSVIFGLSLLLEENRKLRFLNGNYEVVFSNSNGDVYNYNLEYDNGIVVKEILDINNESYISRQADGEGFIVNTHGQKIDFKIPHDELIATRRDEKQYPFLDDLYDWARTTRLFNFGTDVTKTTFGFRDKTKNSQVEYNLKQTGNIIDTLNRGIKSYGSAFKERIIEDFNSIGFNITDIELGGLTTMQLEIIDKPDIEVIGLKVKEADIECWTEQFDMSNGMLRALSLIIQFNYYELEKISGCVLIDDIGEGLDYERSVKLIKLLIDKVESGKNEIQLVMSTNDRFVMNSVDLKYWQIISRSGCKVMYYNEENSKSTFDDFKFTGLNNFDFFATDFFKTGFDSTEINKDE